MSTATPVDTYDTITISNRCGNPCALHIQYDIEPADRPAYSIALQDLRGGYATWIFDQVEASLACEHRVFFVFFTLPEAKLRARSTTT